MADEQVVADPNELVYVEHDDGDEGTVDEGAWVPRSSLRQWAQSNWFEATPPAQQPTTLAEVRTGKQIAAANVDALASGVDVNQSVAISNDTIGGHAVVPLSAYLTQWQHSGWTLDGAAPDPAAAQPIVRDGEFDPAAHNAKAVTDYLKSADDAERARVIAVENSKPEPRKTITGWQPPAGNNNQEGAS